MANAQAATVEKPPVYLPPDRSEIIRVALVGAVTGAATGLLAWLIGRYFIEPVFCRTADSAGICSASGNISFYVATVIVAILAVVALARFAIYRPLVVAAAATASLWGINNYLGRLSWLEYGLWLTLLFGVGYLLFYWLMRLRSLGWSLAVALLAVALVRWLILL